MKEKQLLNQRGFIETVIGHLKHCYQVWHTRHRSIINAMTHLVAANPYSCQRTNCYLIVTHKLIIRVTRNIDGDNHLENTQSVG
jgi:hypothetical protein